MKRQANPQLSSSGELALVQYEQTLREREDLAGASVRIYVSDVRHFIGYDQIVQSRNEAGFATGR